MTTMGYSIPLDLTFEILLRLPAKSVLRFKSVSKSWRSIISSQQFIDAFMSLSFTRPRLVIASCDRDGRMLFNFSHHQSGSFLSSSSMSLADKNTMPKVKSYNAGIWFINSVRGFVCCGHWKHFVVFNPTTGQVIHIVDEKDDAYYYRMYLGYDPNSDQFKLLRTMSPKFSNSHVEHSVRTLGGKGSSHSWRPIKTNITNYDCSPNGVCIDGVVYYYGYNNLSRRMLSCFDVGSEELRLIETPEEYLTGDLTEYIGKLAVHCSIDNGCRLWVLEDVKNQVWSKNTCIFQSFSQFAGINASGEIVYVVRQRFYDHTQLFCYDVENRMERRIKLEELPKIRRSDLSFLLCSYVENMFYL